MAVVSSNGHLVVFDVDGTLTQTNGVDGKCFQAASREILGIENVSTDWGSYQQSTDSGIFEQLHKQQFGGPASTERRDLFRDYFVKLLGHEPEQAFEAVPGAAIVLSTLSTMGYSIAIATGAWRSSAALKLERAKIAFSGYAMLTADEANAREEIVRLAIAKAAKSMESTGFKRVTYVGDGLWDLKAARILGISFVGRIDPIHNKKFPSDIPVIDDYTDIAPLLRALNN